MANVTPRYTPGEIKEDEIIRIPGKDGTVKEMMRVEGLMIPIHMIKSGHIPDIRENVKKVRDMKCRDDDIFLCAYARSGTHWVWEITNMLTTGKPEYLKQPKEAAMLEFNYPEEFDAIPSRRTLNTHWPLRLLPTDVKAKKLKVIFIQRNPKDVIVSLYHFLKKAKDAAFKGSFDDFFMLFTTVGLMVNWFDYTLEAEKVQKDKTLDIHVVYYEELKKNPVLAIKRLSEFLGTNCDDEYITKVAEMCTFKGMKKANEDVKEMDKFMFEEDMMKGHYRKGQIGDWKNTLTVAQSEQFDKIFAERMKDSSFKFDFSE
ncbi:sulfotransferase 1A1-like [Ylistrum balloti]|uniref:sulfotransferase 1A1-like n=1 Tax=Ylistrum balloti TaxID=509963 RepID=UPI002905C749|nr:sulfotransferase 1A1-like [Ylistrum balloti]